jgi:hypothetical protein
VRIWLGIRHPADYPGPPSRWLALPMHVDGEAM